jgi:putative hydrolase of the HAD superfamily
MRRALLFDLDDTLVVEEPAAAASFAATARAAAAKHRVDAEVLATAARERARELWYAAPTFEYCMRVGISSWEGLWCRFEGDDSDMRWLRDWSPRYRREAWSLALADQGVHDPVLAEELGELYGAERRQRHEPFADVSACLDALRGSYSLALVTNGASCLQREKLAEIGLEEYFDTIVVSAELGVGKPDAAIFKHALNRLDVAAEQTTMIGDSLARDVDGASAVGLRGIWINRDRRHRPQDRADVIEIAALTELPAALERIEATPPCHIATAAGVSTRRPH